MLMLDDIAADVTLRYFHDVASAADAFRFRYATFDYALFLL